MKTPSTQAMSRPLGVAAELSGAPIDISVLKGRPVMLTGERAALLTRNGQLCFLDCLRVLPRIAPAITVAVPPGLGMFNDQVRVLAETAYSQGTISLMDRPAAFRGFDAVLNVGCEVRNDLAWTSVNSSGWVVRASSNDGSLPCDMTRPNPVAALMAASIGVTEIFKRICRVPVTKIPPLPMTEFSLFTLSASDDRGPPLPYRLQLPDTLIVGAGAIGNGIVLLLSQLPIQGRIHIVDDQAYAAENLGTCALLDNTEWLGKSKAERLADWLKLTNSDVQATGEAITVEAARGSTCVKSMDVDLVLNGLDDISARHDSQLMWPSVLVDGGINAVGAAVVTHRLDKVGAACLRCGFVQPAKDGRALQQQATGLSAEVLNDLGQPLSDADIERAEESRQPWLREMQAQGKTRCATVGAAVSERLGVNLANAFRPSVPFVATAAASLVMSEAIKAVAYPCAHYTHRFQIESLFLGPQSSIATFQPASSACLCTTQRNLIDELAASRSTRPRR